MKTISGTIDAVRKDRKGLCIDDVWYSSWDALTCNKGDEVVFNFIEKGRFNNIKGKVNVSKAGSPSSSGGGGKSYGGGFSQTGVELGHASNLAMRMMEQYMHTFSVEVGSTEYYKKFTEFTMDTYKVMKKLRDAVDGKSETSEKPEPKKEVADDEDDLF